MNVLILTLLVSLCLSMLFMVLFLDERRSKTHRSSERAALMPLEEETGRVIAKTAARK